MMDDTDEIRLEKVTQTLGARPLTQKEWNTREEATKRRERWKTIGWIVEDDLTEESLVSTGGENGPAWLEG